MIISITTTTSTRVSGTYHWSDDSITRTCTASIAQSESYFIYILDLKCGFQNWYLIHIYDRGICLSFSLLLYLYMNIWPPMVFAIIQNISWIIYVHIIACVFFCLFACIWFQYEDRLWVLLLPSNSKSTDKFRLKSLICSPIRTTWKPVH